MAAILVNVRTTIDLPPSLLRAAKRLAAERQTTLSEVVSDALGAHLGAKRRGTPDKPFELIVRGRAGGRFPTAAEIGAATDEEDLAALRIPGIPRRAAP
jgi:hypothetical protein